VQIGNLVFAYVRNNIAGLVGEVTSEAFYDSKDDIGSAISRPSVPWYSIMPTSPHAGVGSDCII